MLRKQIRQMPNLRYTARDRPHNLQRRLIRMTSRGGILTLSGVRLLASSFAVCLRNFTFCASVVMGPLRTRRCCSFLASVLAPRRACRRRVKFPPLPEGDQAIPFGIPELEPQAAVDVAWVERSRRW